ncbi:MAG: TRAP transporter small permease [bacterium]
MKNFSKFYHNFENIVMGVLLLCLVLLSFYQVGGRLFFNAGIKDGDTIVYHLVLWTGLWGAILATRDKQHINIDVISRFASVRNRFLIQSITNIFSAIICGILLWASILFIRDEIHYTQTTILNIRLWIYQLIIPYAFLITSVRFFIYSATDFLIFLSFPRKDRS